MFPSQFRPSVAQVACMFAVAMLCCRAEKMTGQQLTASAVGGAFVGEDVEKKYLSTLDRVVGGDREARAGRLAVALLGDSAEKKSHHKGRSSEICCCLR